MNRKYLLFVFILTTCFFSFQRKGGPVIHCYEAFNLHPLFDSKAKVVKYDSTVIRIYTYGDKRLYDLVYAIDPIADNAIVHYEFRRHFLLFKKDSLYGYDFDSTRDHFRQKVPIDSAFKMEWIIQNNLHGFQANVMPVQTLKKIDKKNGNLYYEFLMKDKTDSSDIGTISFLYSNQFSTDEVSLYKEMDTVKNMKLIEVYQTSFKRYNKKYDLMVDFFKIKLGLRRIPVLDSQLIMSYFDQL